MARKDGNFLRGVLGGLVFRVVNGKQRVSTRPGRIKQSRATRISNQTFGKASSLGGQIRKILYINVENNFDPTAGSRLTAALRKILGKCRNPETKRFDFQADSFSAVRGFDFNIHSRMENQMAVIPTVTATDGTLQVSVNEIAVSKAFNFPSESFKCELKVSLSLYRLKEGLAYAKTESQGLEMTKYMELLAAHTFTFEVPDGCLCIVSMSLRFFNAGTTGWIPLYDKKINPSCICGALVTPGTYQQDKRKRWVDMVRFE